MNNYSPIQEVIDRLKHDYDWTHSFIRECYFATARNLKEFEDASGNVLLGDTAGSQDVRLIIACAGNLYDTGIEFLMRGIGVFSVQKLDELSFAYDFDTHSGHLVRFAPRANDGGECFFSAKSVIVRFLQRDYQGIGLRLGSEFPADDTAIAESLHDCWRQCSLCGNAWEEIPAIEFSRCPTCGHLTHLAISPRAIAR